MHGNGRNATHATPQQHTQQRGHQQYYAQHDFDGPAEMTTTLVHAISNVTGADVTEAEATLDDHVDPRALNRLLRPKLDGTPRTGSQLQFTIWGYQVTVFGDGQITIVPCQQQPAPQR